MGKSKIDFEVLDDMLRGQGKTHQQCAKHFGCSRVAITNAVKRLGIAMTRNIVNKKAGLIVDKNINAVDQLQKINDSANEILDLLMAWQRGDSDAIRILESQVKYVKWRGKVKGEKTPKGKDLELAVDRIKFKDPRELALKAMAEIRGQLKLQLEIFQCLYDIEAVKKFQESVLASIKEVAPDVQRRIIDRLTRDNAARRATRDNRLKDQGHSEATDIP